jgi:hypothetical protein
MCLAEALYVPDAETIDDLIADNCAVKLGRPGLSSSSWLPLNLGLAITGSVLTMKTASPAGGFRSR